MPFLLEPCEQPPGSPGTPAHSWQAVAAGGMSIGHKGMMVAAKNHGTIRYRFNEGQKIDRSRKARVRDQKRGPDFKYEALLGDIEPPLDFRKGF